MDFDLARLIRRPVKESFSSTEWHREMVRLMAQEAGVSQSLVMRAAIEFMSTNFSLDMFRSTDSERHMKEQAGVSGLLFSSFDFPEREAPQPKPGEPVNAGGEGWVLEFVE